jgi:hypothetical protein
MVKKNLCSNFSSSWWAPQHRSVCPQEKRSSSTKKNRSPLIFRGNTKGHSDASHVFIHIDIVVRPSSMIHTCRPGVVTNMRHVKDLPGPTVHLTTLEGNWEHSLVTTPDNEG